MEPLVSIALCTYNGEKYLAQQLESILQQDYSNLEIVVVDDCSSDQTLDILNRYQKKYPNFLIVKNEENIGFNKNFKKAIELCKGEYISIADQDDIWLPEKISTMISHVGQNLLLYHNSNYIDHNGISLGSSTLSHHRFVSGFCTLNLIYYNCVSGHACLFHRSLLTIASPFPAHFYYDWWLAYSAACVGRIGSLTTALVKHRIHSESSTQQDQSKAKEFRIAHLKLFLTHPQTPTTLKPLLVSLLKYYEALRFEKFSLKLFVLLVKNANQLFYIRKKSLFSRAKFILNECIK